MEAKMQMRNRIDAGVTGIELKPPPDYSAMKAKLIREARVAQAAAIRAACTRLIAAVTAFAARLNHPTGLPSPQPKHGD
jgi:hypothetical protein